MRYRLFILTFTVFMISAFSGRAQYIDPSTRLSRDSEDSLSVAVPVQEPSKKAAADSPSGKSHKKGRIDRGINDISFAYKGEVSVGLSVSYQTLTTDNANFLVLLDQMKLSGSKFTVKPSVGYFLKDNLSIGARFGYSQATGRIDNFALDLGPQNDLSLSLSDIGYKSSNIMASAYMRSYAGIDRKGHFGLFAELELKYENGNSRFSYKSDGALDMMKSHHDGLDLLLKAGAAVYFLPNVMCHLSFGLGGIGVDRIVQKNEAGELVGNRIHSKMSWKLNLLDIALGFSVHL